MDYRFLDKAEYEGIRIIRIVDSRNDLPFFIAKLENQCNREKHRHEFVQIIYILKGKLTHVINNNRFEVCKGDIFVIPPYVPHYYIDDPQEKFELIEFEFIPEFINENFSLHSTIDSFLDFAYLEPFLVAESEVRPRLNLTGRLQLDIEQMLNEAIFEYEARNADFALIIKALLLRLLVLVGREFRRDVAESDSQGLFMRHRNALDNAILYINKNYAENISVEEISRVAMLSQSYFRYLFKQMTQRALNEYISDLRISRSIELLKTRQDLKVIDVCYEVGFKNVNHFNRVFRQKTGVSPMVFRKSAN